MTRKQQRFEWNHGSFPIGERTYVMGILNVNPDSFSDGGKYFKPEHAVLQAKAMASAGADLLDIGGESTRPGYAPVSCQDELDRIIPVIVRLREEMPIEVVLSIDTQKAEVASQALQVGANIVNDIWGLQGDPEMADVVAKASAGVIVMHNSHTGEYTDIIENIKEFFIKSILIATKAGIAESHIMLDPGIGFAKTFYDNIEILSRMKELNALGFPLLLGTSRKRFLGTILDRPVEERLEGTLATSVLGIAAGVDFLRVHDVEEIKRAALVSDAILRR